MTNPDPSSWPADLRVALVTGAYGAIGVAIARGIAKAAGFGVVLVGRDAARCERAARDVAKATGNPYVRAEAVDLSRQAPIQALAERWSGPLHVLVNNAAECPRRRAVTEDGLERQFATNIMGYVWLTLAFRPVLKASAPARIVNVASYWAGDLALDDLQFTRRRYDNDTAYRQSKQANRMLTVAFAERLDRDGIAVSVCHPGDVNSKLSNDLGFGGHESPDQGAATPVMLAVEPVGQHTSGRYFAHGREERCRFGANRQAVEALYEECMRFA